MSPRGFGSRPSSLADCVGPIGRQERPLAAAPSLAAERRRQLRRACFCQIGIPFGAPSQQLC